jgi:hypothetical protein
VPPHLGFGKKMETSKVKPRLAFRFASHPD